MSAILFIAAFVVAFLMTTIVMQHRFICILQRLLHECLNEWEAGLKQINQKLENEADWWKK